MEKRSASTSSPTGTTMCPIPCSPVTKVWAYGVTTGRKRDGAPVLADAVLDLTD